MQKIMVAQIDKGFLTEGKHHTFWDPIIRIFPPHGWKIHISCFHDNFTEILKIVSNYCFNSNISFKFINNIDTLKLILSKNSNREESGKFITIYPFNETEFKKIIRELYPLLKDHHGPYILSDKRYLNSKVIYYRYGIINSTTDEMFFNGDIYIDQRVPYYNQPSFVEDPLHENTNISNEKISTESRLSEFDNIEAIHFSNSGGIYFAEKDNKKVILKEARPFIGISNNNDSIICRKNEGKLLKYLEKSGCTPKLYSSFYEWEHFFLVVEHIEGESLLNFISKISLILVEEKDKQEIESRIIMFKCFIKNLLDSISIVHNKNIIINDISENNILITDDLKPVFIDLEDAFHIEESKIEKIIINNKEISDNRFHTLDDKKKDIHKLGYLLMKCISNADYRLKFDPSGEQSGKFFLHFCKYYGVHQGIYDCISKMISGEYSSIKYLMNILKNSREMKEDQGVTLKVIPSSKKIHIIAMDNLFVRILAFFDDIKKFKWVNSEFTVLQHHVEENNLTEINKFLLSRDFDPYSPSIHGGILEEISIYIYLYSQFMDPLYLDTAKEKIDDYIKKYVCSNYLVRTNDGYFYPYMTHTAGLVKLLITFLKFKHSKDIYDLVIRLLSSIDRNFTKEMGYLNGLLGIADALVDGYSLTNEKKYIDSAIKKINTAYEYINKEDSTFLYGTNSIDYLIEKITQRNRRNYYA